MCLSVLSSLLPTTAIASGIYPSILGFPICYPAVTIPRVQAPALQRCSKPCSGTRRQVTLGSRKSPREVKGGVRGPAPSLAMLQHPPHVPSKPPECTHQAVSNSWTFAKNFMGSAWPGSLGHPLRALSHPSREPRCGRGAPRQDFGWHSATPHRTRDWADMHSRPAEVSVRAQHRGGCLEVGSQGILLQQGEGHEEGRVREQ